MIVSTHERCEIVEDVLNPDASRAHYAIVDDDGHTRSIQLPIEPRVTLLERGRRAWLDCYSTTEPYRAGHA